MTRPIAFLRPESVAEAIALLVEHGEDARVVAGSTAVSIMLHQGLIDPAALVSIGDLPEPDLRTLEQRDGWLRIGALVTHRNVERDATVRGTIPVLADTFRKVANVRVRNQATVGGVMAEADYASDPPAVFLALEAEVEARGPEGTRRIAVADFFLDFYATSLEPAELITAMWVPVPPPGTHAAYEKFVTRSFEDRPCVGVLGLVRLAPDGVAADVRVAVGAAAETPQRFRDLEQTGIGTDLSDRTLRSIADGYAERIEPLDDLRGSAWYRTEMIRVWVRRALERARDEARASLHPGHGGAS